MTPSLASALAHHSHLTADPGVCGGRPRIRGTRITVAALWSLYWNGAHEHDLWRCYPELNPEQIRDAISFAHSNQALLESFENVEASDSGTGGER
jgi:uncharacterized protein (DUF433 family)